MSWPRLEVVRVVTVFDANENRRKECERLGKITERKGFEKQFLTLLMEVNERSNRLLSSLPTRSAPMSQGDDMGIVGRLVLRAEDVPPLVTDEDEDGLTDRDAEGSVDEGED